MAVGRVPWGIAGHHHTDHWASLWLSEIKTHGAQALNCFASDTTHPT